MKKIKIFFLFTILLHSNASHALLMEMCSLLGVVYTFINNTPGLKEQFFTEKGSINIPAAYGAYQGITNYAGYLWQKVDTFLGRQAPNWWHSEENFRKAEAAKEQAAREETVKIAAQNEMLQQELEKKDSELKEAQSRISYLQSYYHEHEKAKAVMDKSTQKDTEIRELQKQISDLQSTKVLEQYKKELDEYKKETVQYKTACGVLYFALVTTVQQSRQQFQLPTNSLTKNQNCNDILFMKKNCYIDNRINNINPNSYNPYSQPNPYYLNNHFVYDNLLHSKLD